jgi:hypothetical protein
MCVLLFLVILPVSFYLLLTNLVYVRSDHPWVLYFVSPVLILYNDPDAPLSRTRVTRSGYILTLDSRH